MTGRYLEDFAVGQIFRSGPLPVDEERIKTFAAEFDPQPSRRKSAGETSSVSAPEGPAFGRPAGGRDESVGSV